MNFYDMKIKTRLALGFGVIVLLLVALGAVTMIKNAAMSSTVDDIVHRRMPTLQTLAQLQNEANLQARGMRNMVLMSKAEDVQKEESNVLASRRRVGELYTKLDPLIHSADGKALLTGMQESRSKYAAGVDRFREFVSQGKREDAILSLYAVDSFQNLSHF